MATNPATVGVGRAERGPPAIGSGEATVTLDDRYEIYPGKRLPAFDAPGTLAYHALDNNAPRSELFALVCNPNAPMRLGALRIMRKLNSDWFVTPLHWGAVHWPEVERRCPVIVFERPSGAPLLSSLDAVIAPMDEKALTTTIIEPVVRALGVLSDTGINHRGLQPCNIFYRKNVGTEIIFGECVSTPPGMGQTMVFETIEGAMTDPVARGPGDQSDDIYALGVTVLTMLMGRRPGAGIDDSAMIVSKIEEGSYAALIGDFQPPGAMATLLRGLLADDRKQRWTLSELKKWLKGARPEPRSAEREPRTDRPFVFEGRKYRTCWSLAYGLACNPAAAAKLAETGTIENWVQNQIRDADRTKALAEARKIPVSGGTANRAADHLLAARVITVLDPLGPIRYKRLAINIEGFGPALALAMTDKSAVGAMIEIVLGDLPNFWASQQKLNHYRYVTVADSLDSLRSVLREPGLGFGLEWCLYQLNPTLPCKSRLIGHAYASTAGELLTALEQAAKRTDQVLKPVDRHIAAFAGARIKGLDKAAVMFLAAARGKARQAVAMTRLLAHLQRVARIPALPGLAGWLANLMAPVISEYYERRLRDELAATLAQVARRGELAALLAVVENATLKERDLTGYREARAVYAKLDAEVAQLRGGSALWPEHRERFNGTASVVAASMLALIVLALLATSGLVS